MENWFDSAVFYHLYPLGFCGCEQHQENHAEEHRILKICDWIPHLKELSVTAIYLGPLFASASHGYDTSDYRTIDPRLGTNADFTNVCKALHDAGIRIVLDGIFNHVGRDFWAFQDVLKQQEQSAYCGWFCNLRFHETNPYQDPFVYENWEGHWELVKLNLNNPEVVNYLMDTITMWIDTFGIDGLRLDAANCIDFNFFKQLRQHCKNQKADFWLMGEIIHGDYNRWANQEMLDSVTNYECYKGLYSAHNTRNYFEIAHSINRQFGPQGIYKHLKLYNFTDNHDVNRLASTLQNKQDLYNVYTLLFTMPGIPSIYYGSEWGLEGWKGKDTDAPLRPSLELQNPAYDLALADHIAALSKLHQKLSALRGDEYETVLLRNEQFIFKRTYKDNVVYVACNLDEQPYEASWNVQGNVLMDELNDHALYSVENQTARITIPAKRALILVCMEREPHNYDESGDQASVDTNLLSGSLPMPGRYRHFKGKEYEVLTIAKHSETLEDYVVYRKLYGDGSVWIRPLAMFYETIEINGKKQSRFTPICED